MKNIIKKITDVKEIGVDDFFKYIPQPDENHPHQHIILDILKSCPSETELEKVILYNVPISHLDRLFEMNKPTNDLFRKMPDGKPKWDMDVYQYKNFGVNYEDEIKRVGRVTFTKCKKPK